MLWDNPFFDVAWAPGSPFLRTPVHPVGPFPGWVEQESGPWSLWAPLTPDRPLPEQGWKVHVSALPRDAATVNEQAARICREEGAAHKMLRTRELVTASQLKYADPVQAGKVFTCYPPADRLEVLALRLADELPALEHPRVQGEPCLAGSPVSLRHGAFRAEWLLDADGLAHPAVTAGGERVEDRRGRSAPEAPELPAGIRARLAGADPEGAQLDISQVRLLHRSNAGGVYAAQWHGRQVVLKEAREHCGLGLDEQPATVRLRHEWQALRRLAGTGVAPEPLDYLHVGDSEFLIMSLIRGLPLSAVLAARHPQAAPGADRAGYLDWLRATGDRLAALVATMNRAGVVHGDLHPGNLMDGPDGLVAIDFESSTIDGTGPAAGLHHPQFSRAGQDADAHADEAARTRVMEVLEAPTLLSADQSAPVQDEILRVGSLELRGGDGPAPETRTPPLGLAELVAGVRAFADPSRPDRVFPGDPVQFQRPGAGLGLLHGDAGVLLCLHLLGEEPDPALLDLLCSRVDALRVLPRGMADGAEGMAWALLGLGRPETAGRLLDRCLARGLPGPDCPWWANGTAGVGAVLRKAGTVLGRPELNREASRQDELTREALRAGLPGRAGLLHGWAGVGLALLGSRDDNEQAREDAGTALRLESRGLTVEGGRLVAADGNRRVPYLGHGAIAAGLLVHRLGPEQPEQPKHPEQPEDDGAGALPGATTGVCLEACRESCRSSQMLEAGLLGGRAGMLTALRTLAPDDPTCAEHTRRLRWGCVEAAAADGGSYPVVLGRLGVRASLDLATGSAGVALALTPEPWAAVSAALALA